MFHGIFEALYATDLLNEFYQSTKQKIAFFPLSILLCNNNHPMIEGHRAGSLDRLLRVAVVSYRYYLVTKIADRYLAKQDATMMCREAKPTACQVALTCYFKNKCLVRA